MGTVRIKDHWGEQRLFESRAMAAAVIVVVLTLNEFIVWGIEGWTNHQVSTSWRWIQPMVGGMLWPFVALMLGRTHQRH